MAIAHDHAFPVCFALMEKRTHEAYSAIFKYLKSVVPEMDPKIVMSDFENAILRAVKEEFGDAVIVGCWWHFANGNMELQNKIINFFTKLRFRNIPKPPYNHVVQLGDPILRYKCKAVERSDLQNKEFKEVLHKLRKAVQRYKCAGLSAPQLGVNLRVMAITLPSESDYYGTPQEYQLKRMQPYPYTVWINPSMKVLDYSKLTFAEGCESMRGYTADVARYTRIQLSGWDEEGGDKQEELSGWLARVAQHEMDHLDGKLYLDAAQLSTLVCSYWNRVNQTGGKVHLSYYPNKTFSKG